MHYLWKVLTESVTASQALNQLPFTNSATSNTMMSGGFGYNRKGNDAMSGVTGATTITPLTRAGSRRQQSGLATSGVVKIEDQQILLETVVDLFIKMMLTRYVCKMIIY